jgi:glycosyltransferase involved in cell wall biosynthesis
MASRAPTVSVIVPVLDAGAYLAEALESLRAQTFGDFEVVIVDDGSSEPRTLAELARAEAGGARVIRLPHGGVVAARTRGIAEATGEYLCFFDADDRMRPELLAHSVARLRAAPALAFVSFWVRLFGDQAWDWQPQACDLAALLGDCTVATAALVRRSVVQAVAGFDAAMERGHEDWDLWLRIVAAGHAGEILPEVLFEYRRRADSRSTVADRDANYLALLAARIARHPAHYDQHAAALLQRRDRELCERLARLADTTALALERAALDRRAESLEARRQRAEAALVAALDRTWADGQALRTSVSWRVMGPLRRGWSLLQRGGR